MSAISVVISMMLFSQSEEREASLKAMRQRVQDSRVTLVNKVQVEPQLRSTPIFRYNDELRRIEDAGVWLWTDHNRPVAMMKVEHYQEGVFSKQWLYCFASLSPELISAEWEGRPAFQARRPGVTWKPLVEKASKTRAGRLLQMREIARRFSGEIQEPTANSEAYQLRLLTQPLYRYEEAATGTEDGSIFGFTGTGTNPDCFLLLEVNNDATWQYGLAAMTAAGVTVRLDGNLVSEIPGGGGRGTVFDTWTYFLAPK